MIESISAFILANASHAHWFVFGALILAGANIPISADLMILLSAVLAASFIPEHTTHLYLCVLCGCCLSAWVAYWLGRGLGPKIIAHKWLGKIFSQARVNKMENFHKKYGFFALVLGRFIPFGVRNCIFFSSGMSKIHFGKFALMDSVACFIWSTSLFTLFYKLGQNYQALYHYSKLLNLVIFSVFGVTIIGIVWYKKRKDARAKKSQDSA